MLKKVSLILSVLFLFSCKDSYKGQLNLTDDLNVSLDEFISKGLYNSKITFRGKKKIKIELEGNNNKEKLVFKLKNGAKLPSYDGSFSYYSVDTGMPFDIQGRIDTEEVIGDIQQARESCQTSYPFLVRRRFCDPRSRRQVCTTRLITQYRIVQGRRLVEFRNVTINKKLDLFLLLEGSDIVIGDFQGKDISYEREILSQGACIPHFL